MSDEIIKAFDTLGEQLGVAIDWSQENVCLYIQDLCQRIAQYKLTSNIIVLIIWAIIFALSICGIIFIIKKLSKNIDIDMIGDVSFGLSICGLLIFSTLIILSLVMSIQSINNICMCVYVPERVLINMLHSI